METNDIISIINRIQNSENVTQNLELLYCKNKNYIYYMAKCLKVPASQLDDFMQLSYLALYKAVRSYNSQYSFSNYFSLFIRHEYYDFYLRMCFPIKVSHTFYQKFKEDNCPILESYIPLDYYVEGPSSDDVQFEDYISLRVELWTIIRDNMSSLNFYIVQQRFINCRTFQDIGDELGIGKDRVRKRLVRCFQHLRENKRLKSIAADYFNIC